MQGAILALLGLLLGLCFAGAMARFVERQDIILHEANAVGTLYQRADLLDFERGEQVRGILPSETRQPPAGPGWRPFGSTGVEDSYTRSSLPWS